MLNYLIVLFFFSQSMLANAFWTKELKDDLFRDSFFRETTEEERSPLIQESYPRSIRWIFENVLNWKPGLKREFIPKCDFSNWERKIIQEENLFEKSQLIEKMLIDCESTRSTNAFLGSLKFLSQQMDHRHHPHFHFLTLHFPGGIKTKALFAFHDHKPRDLIIIRPGIFNSLEVFLGERFWLMQIFEQLQLNVIYIESSSSPDSLINNKKLLLGGVREGFENIYLIKKIKENKFFKSLINRIHLVGVSFGGNGVLFSSYLNQLSQYQYFKKTLLFCPLVDFPSTVKKGLEPSLKNYVFDIWSSFRYKELEILEGVPPLSSFWESLFSLRPRYGIRTYEMAVKNYSFLEAYRNEFTSQPPLPLARALNFGSFFSGNFEKDLSFYRNMTKFPDQFFLIGSRKDQVVPLEENFDQLLKIKSKNDFTFLFSQDYHCSMVYNYDWNFLSSFIASLLQEKGYQATRQLELVPLSKVVGPAVRSESVLLPELSVRPSTQSVARVQRVELKALESSDKDSEKKLELLVYFYWPQNFIGHLVGDGEKADLKTELVVVRGELEKSLIDLDKIGFNIALKEMWERFLLFRGRLTVIGEPTQKSAEKQTENQEEKQTEKQAHKQTEPSRLVFKFSF